MTSEKEPDDQGRGEERPGDLDHQQVQVPNTTARVPEAVGRGVFSTGAIVMVGQYNVVIDFVQQFGSPAQLVSRVVMPHQVLAQFVAALDQNLNMFVNKFGTPPPMPRPENPERRSVKEIYDNIKLPEEKLSGSFAEAVMIRHSPAEFCLDFITRFFPHAAVSSRVFLSAAQVPPFLHALKANLEKLQGGGPAPGEGQPPHSD